MTGSGFELVASAYALLALSAAGHLVASNILKRGRKDRRAEQGCGETGRHRLVALVDVVGILAYGWATAVYLSLTWSAHA